MQLQSVAELTEWVRIWIRGLGGWHRCQGSPVLLELCDTGLSLGLCPDLHLHARERGGTEREREEKGGRERGGREWEERRGGERGSEKRKVREKEMGRWRKREGVWERGEGRKREGERGREKRKHGVRESCDSHRQRQNLSRGQALLPTSPALKHPPSNPFAASPHFFTLLFCARVE